MQILINEPTDSYYWVALIYQLYCIQHIIQNIESDIKPSMSVYYFKMLGILSKGKNHSSIYNMSNNLTTITQQVSVNVSLSASKIKTDFVLYLWCEKHLAGIPKELCIYYCCIHYIKTTKAKTKRNMKKVSVFIAFEKLL